MEGGKREQVFGEQVVRRKIVEKTVKAAGSWVCEACSWMSAPGWRPGDTLQMGFLASRGRQSASLGPKSFVASQDPPIRCTTTSYLWVRLGQGP